MVDTQSLITNIILDMVTCIHRLVHIYNFFSSKILVSIFIFIYILYINNLEKMEIDLQQNE